MASKGTQAGRRPRGILEDGLIAGVIGFIVVNIVLAIMSTVAGASPFEIHMVLGQQLFFRDAGSPAVVDAVLAYSGVHLAVSLLAGLFMSWLSRLSELAPQAWYFAFSLLLYVGAHVVVVPIWFDARVASVVTLWQVSLATVVAALAMGTYLWQMHPGIRRAMHEPDD